MMPAAPLVPEAPGRARTLVRSAVLVLACAALAGGPRAQLTDQLRERWLRSADTARRTVQIEPTELQQIEAGEMAYQGAIDPETYRLSPGDRLALSIWGATNEVIPLVVAADGGLVVPSVGVLPVDGLTLGAAGRAVRERARSFYRDAEITLTLVRPALLRIPVTGMVVMPGTYEVPATYRLGDLLALAGGLREGGDSRDLRITHRDGSLSACDQLAWLVDGQGEGNPALASGDQVFAPPARQTYRVRGLFPATLEEAPARSSVVDRPFEARTRLIAAGQGDDLAFVLRAAGGLGSEFCDSGVWLERGEGSGAPRRRWIPLAQTEGFAMRPGDVVEVPFCAEWVAVGGSVTRPGLYPYLPGETVAHYVYAAGGPSQFGSTRGWKIRLPGSTGESGASGSDTVAAGSMIRVPERRTNTIANLLTPVATAAAVIVSIVALANN